MRPKLSALTTTILGAVLTASTVSAQQSPKVDPAPRSKADAPDAPDGADALLGQSATRGARYLLRNGLDYLNYQQYERALKFLREAENRQKELNSAERLSLKKGIERAQRGLRDAADAESPYAISDRSHRGKGFTAAKSETEIASANDRRNGPARAQVADQQASSRGPERSQRNESIQLASADQFVADPTPSAASAANNQVTLTDATNRTKRLPTIPASTTDVKADDLKTAPPAEGADLLAALPPLDPVIDGSVAGSTKPVHPVKEDQAAVKAAQVTPIPGTPDTSMPAAPAPPAVQAVIELTTPAVAPAGNSAPDQSPAMAPSASTPAPAVIDLERITLPNDLNPGAPAAVNSNGVAARQEPEVTTTSAPGPKVPETATGSSATAVSPTPASSASLVDSAGTDDLPPLPAVIGQSAETPVREPAVMPVPSEPSNPPAPVKLNLPAATSIDLGASHLETESLDTKAPVTEPVVTPATSVGGAQSPDRTQSATPIEPTPSTVSPESMPAPTPIAPVAPVAPVADFELPELPKALNSTPAANPGEAVRPVPAPTVRRASAAVAATPEQAPAPYPTSNPNLASPAAPVGIETGLENPAPPPQVAPGTMTRLAQSSPFDLPFTDRPTPPSTLRPELQREVEEIARRQEDELRRRTETPAQPPGGRDSTAAAELRAQTQLDISRAPSPAEARPIKAIPVPEDWVPLPERDWSPQRKYWSAAATCHLPLYFQDPVLERYGHSVEQFVGPFGRYLSYPLDDPTQSNQRNQLVQPWFSIGLFGLQIAAWPYNLIMDPPWEAQYDLGYYRPGDRIPTDLYWLPLHGYGPPLHGSRY